MRVVKIAALAASLAVALGGCTYDYLQHTDRVAYSAGDAVKANLEGATIDPARNFKNKTVGLGKNGSVASTQPTVNQPIVGP